MQSLFSQQLRKGLQSLLLIELVDENNIRVLIETGSDRASLLQRRAGNRIQVTIGNNGIAFSQPPSVFTEDSFVNGSSIYINTYFDIKTEPAFSYCKLSKVLIEAPLLTTFPTMHSMDWDCQKYSPRSYAPSLTKYDW